MALNAPNDEQKRPPIQYSVGVESVLVKELEKVLIESENRTLPELLESLLVLGLLAWVKTIADKTEREKLETLLRERNIELRVVERADDTDDELGDPAESFRIAWGEAMRGEFMTLDEFRRSMADDD